MEGMRIDSHIHVSTGPRPLDPGGALRFVSTPEAGGTVLFSGTVRSPNDGQDVDHLDYEVWTEKVDTTLRDIAEAALQRHGATRAHVTHRTGRVEVGEPSVLVCVSAPHRDAAFDAAREIIDTLKAQAPIWKKEVTTSGEQWVGMPSSSEVKA